MVQENREANLLKVQSKQRESKQLAHKSTQF